jgi:hypothetical protein
MPDGHAVYILGCERNITDINEPCAKPTVAVVCERSKDDSRLGFAPLRMCQGHAWMHTKDPGMEVTWLIELKGV